jgi:hypothetical protein
MAYKPTYNWGAPPCRVSITFDRAAAHEHFARQGHSHIAIIVGRRASDAMLQTHALRGQGIALEPENVGKTWENSKKQFVNHRS